ncbi:MAG: hypothetical protein H0U05_00310 [Actinobacteria bacterium]|nr:hypothetical protein [Actinomycetota bacterium]
MTRLDWEKAAARERSARQGREPAERDAVTRARAVYASDAQVAELRRLGYVGRRPETAAMARAIKGTISQLGVTVAELKAAKRLKGPARAERIAGLRQRLDAGYSGARRALRGSAEKRLFGYLDSTYRTLRNYLDRLEAKRE